MAMANRELEMLSIHCGIGNVLCMYVNSRNIHMIYVVCTQKVGTSSWNIYSKSSSIRLMFFLEAYSGFFCFFSFLFMYLTRFYNLRYIKVRKSFENNGQKAEA